MNIERNREVQSIAKNVLSELPETFTNESTELTIATTAKELLEKHGVTKTWYYDTPAFVLLGSRSCVSLSGKDYQPANEKVGLTNLVTVDLSPMKGTCWGDCARSFPIENGVYSEKPTSSEFKEGLSVVKRLHQKMKEYVNSDTRFSDLFHFGNELIKELDFENLDFLSNLGHSIEVDIWDRRYIDKDCDEFLGNVRLFTFEPHIRKHGGDWGFKHENIYYFDARGLIQEL